MIVSIPTPIRKSRLRREDRTMSEKSKQTPAKKWASTPSPNPRYKGQTPATVVRKGLLRKSGGSGEKK